MLDKQLRRASYLSSSMELCLGFFHELKDNLANIDVTATLLQEQLKEKKTNEIETGMEQIRSQVLRGRAQMDKFVGFIRVSDPIIMEINVADMLDDLLYFMQKELEFTNIQIIRDYDAQVPFVRSDRGKLRQVFQNIVLNAVAAIGKDGVIVLKTRNDHNMVTMTITDNGPGIPPENLEKIFEPLYSSKPEGTGLGLSICQDILTKLGGTIFVTSKVAEETSFVVALPLPIKS
jgi:two-component system NtrC family sensor kinase